MVRVLAARFIPAYAGNTSAQHGGKGRGPVHPRVRGEHSRNPYPAPPHCGSSPRTRGTPANPGVDRPGDRFIPAYAGNTRPPWTGTPATSVHPRVRGEHESVKAEPLRGRGSSPRTRGTLRDERLIGGIGRFIPAYAGNTLPAHDAGEDVTGSSPRTRGTRELIGDLEFQSAVHPRVRGEHLLPDDLVTLLDRFIPAYAGNTPSPPAPRSTRAVHPRVRGEHLSKHLDIEQAYGSSPRTRGTLLTHTVD